MRRVVVTGIGVISPIGNNVSDFWNSLIEGKSGIGPITRFDTTDFKTKFAGEVKNFNPEPLIEPKEARHLDLFSQYGICASEEAVKSSGISFDDMDPFSSGVVLGTGIGGIGVLEKQVEVLLTKGAGRVSPFYIPGMITDIVAGHISMRYGLMGPNFVTTSACASSAHAIGTAFHIIQRGDADVMISGGTEGSITPSSIAGFINIQALSRRNDEKASRPFNKDRDGFVAGEGAVVFILEELEHALKRKANIVAEITGAGFTADAFHVTAPHPEGLGAAKAMEIAIRQSGMEKKDVDYINCHCPSTPPGDACETKAIKLLLGERAYDINISSTKSMHGHLLGAAGAIECAATALALRYGIIPPTINYEIPDPECDLNCTPNKAVKKDIRFALTNNFGFGGHNATIALKKYMD